MPVGPRFLRVAALLAAQLAVGATAALAQQDDAPGDRFVASESMIPMRDGVRLHTRIFVPGDQSAPLPFILVRTPYGTKNAADTFITYLKPMADEGYIFAFQDIRGKFESEGRFV